jgi:hypothetical protein
MRRTNLSALLVIIAISMPATIALVAVGIEPTTAPVAPQVADEPVVEELATVEAPVDEAPPDAPEAVDLESPDPVAEVKTEDPVPDPEPEPEAETRADPEPTVPIFEFLSFENLTWVVKFYAEWDIWQISVVQKVWDVKDWIVLDEYTEAYDPIKGPFISGLYSFEVVDPPESLGIREEYLYELEVTSYNGGVTSDSDTQIIPVEDLFAPQDIDVTTDPADLSEPLTAPPVITITNLGELDLSVDYVIIDDHSGVDPGLVLAGGESADLGVELPADEGIHTVEIWSNDPDENMVLVTYEIEIPDPCLTVVAADFAAGIGSERFGVTVICDPAEKNVTVNVVLEAMSDGDDISPVEVVPVTAPANLSIIVKTLFEDENGDEAEPGVLYQYRVWMTVDGVDQNATLITNVGLWHWSTFTRLRSVSGAWEAKVAWDAIQVPSTAGFSVYVALRKWDGETLWDVTDSEGEQVVVSQEVEGIAAGEATLLLDKPDQKVLGDEVEGGETWMAGMRSGYYFFTYMAENDAGDPWAERIGCPPEAL